MIATVEDGKITRLRPNPDHVVSKGYACPKGIAYREIVHSPDRVTAPLNRSGLISEPLAWKQEGWDEANADIGRRLKAIINESGPESVAMYVGNGAGFGFLHPFWAQGFLTGIGSTNLYGSATQDCSNKFAVARQMYGFPMLQPVSDFENAECFIILGGNPAATKLSFRGVPNPMRALRKASAEGCRIVHINPRRTEAVDAGGEHLAIRPDTDIFFLMAFAGELFRTGGIDGEKVEKHMKNLDALEELCLPWTAEKQADVTGISQGRFRDLSESFRNADGASLYLSTGLNMGRNGALCGWLVEAVNAISGNLDRRGGTLVGKGSLMDFPKLGARFGAMMSDGVSRLGGFRTVNEMRPGAMLADEILTPGKGQIRALLVAAGNPLLTLPDTAKTERAFRSLDLLVTVDIFRSATADFAHWVLPGVTPYEHPDIGYIFHSMMGIGHRRFLQYTDTVVPPVGNSRDEVQIWQDLCRAAGGRFFGSGFLQGIINIFGRLGRLPGSMGRRFRFSHSRILNRFLKVFGKPGVRRMRKEPDGWLLKDPPPGSFLGRRVRTADGLVNLAPPEFLEEAGKLESEFEWEKTHADTLKLINMREAHTHNSFLQSSPTLMKGKNSSNHLHIHPRDAEDRRLIDGDDGLVWSETGCIRLPVNVSDRMSPGSVAIPFGWGQQRTRGLTVASKTGGANVNWLFPSGPDHLERLSLMAHLSGLPVEAVPVPAGIPAVILAGGESRRFGSDKTAAEWKGRTLLAHVMEAATEGGRSAILSVSEAKSPVLGGIPRIFDPDPAIRTPLNGFIAACRVLKGWFLVITADVPGINPAVLELLCSRGASEVNRPVIISQGENLHPFPGLYHSSMIDIFESAFDRGDYRVIDLVRSMSPIMVSSDEIRKVDPELKCLRNVNTPEELAVLD